LKYLAQRFPSLLSQQYLLAILHAHHPMVASLIDAMAARSTSIPTSYPHPAEAHTIHPSRSKLPGILVSLR
jgi:hypothetical protein